MELQERVERLERENRRLKRFGFAVMMCVAVCAGFGFAQVADDTQEAVKARKAKMQLGILNQITQGQDTAPIMQQLIQSAKNGDTTASRTLLDVIFSEECCN